MPDKPKALVLTLGSMERDGWVNPSLCFTLIGMGRDSRFETTFGSVLGYRPFDYARNVALAQARTENPEWCVMLDNDVVPAVSPFHLIADAPKDAAVIGVRYAVVKKNTPTMYPERVQFLGDYQEVPEVGGGVLCIRSTVWQTIKTGPWFQICVKPGELLEWGLGEDVNFCHLVRERGMKVYCHKTPAGHLHTRDLTKLVMQ